MGRLTTHVLDTARGRPAAGLAIHLRRVDPDPADLGVRMTNADGRIDGPLLEGDALVAGTYELVFHAGDYFAASGIDLPSPRFVDQVPIRFGLADAGQHYHVPLLVSPWAWSTYRGS